ncbi:MAG: DNA repair protein RecN [Bacteroidales bacterium]|nr:DNA repair protein RecN [Bacteroidales bacterium]
MLSHLSIKNYTLIDRAEVSFLPGFTVITGETGAGKSILLGALSLLLGKRADPSVLMDKDEKCVVEATFDIHGLNLESFFRENDLDYEPETVLRREIVPSGKSRAFVNDTPVNLNILKDLGEKLVDIHSQHQTLLLNEADFQREVLDGYVNEPELLREYQELFTQYSESERRLAQLNEENQQARRDEDYFRFQLEELQAARLNADELPQLEERAAMLSHAEEIGTSVALARSVLKEDEHSVLDQLNQVKDAFSRLAELHGGIREFVERLRSTVIELSDLSGDIDRFSDLADFDPEEMKQVEDRLDLLYRLQQKHHVDDITDLIEIRDDFQKKLDSIMSLDTQVEEEKARLEKLTVALEEKAKSLSGLRKKVSAGFEKEVEALLKQLGMKDAVFKVEIEVLKRFTPWGRDKITFLFNANKGGQLSKISKSASGGELSRLMLALKSLVQQVQVLPTIIFDEIDSGVSGEIAGKLGNILKKMSSQLQVMAITHLPQIAAKADAHLNVYKAEREGVTTSRIVPLTNEGRLEEIAKMLSDEKITDAARQAALALMQP